ncbi:MAG: hypothetical protein ACYDAY_00945 [Candidatus Dormibacteria bacterium]
MTAHPFLGPSRGASRALAVGLFLVASLAISLVRGAPLSHAAGGTVLILGSTISGGASSTEATDLTALGYTVEIADPSVWATKTTSDFSNYAALVLGDPTCVYGTSPIQAAVDDESIWGPAVTGNVIIIGTDPVYHESARPGAAVLINDGLGFAVAQSGRTGMYIDLSCYYDSTAPHTPVPLLDAISPSGFEVTGTNCYNNAHLVATHPATASLTDADLSNWSCSVHEAFDKWPSSFKVLAIAQDLTTDFAASDGTVGTPYVIVSGTGIVPNDGLALNPANGAVGVGTLYTLTAQLTVGGAHPAGDTVTFTVTAGPNAGRTGTGVTDANGLANFTYTSTTQGVDTVSATTTPTGGSLLTSNNALVDWTPPPPNITFAADGAGEYDDVSSLGAVLTDPVTNAPLPGLGVSLQVGHSTACSATTDATGLATCTEKITAAPTSASEVASFAGSSSYGPGSATRPFAVALEQSVTQYTGQTTVHNGSTAYLTANITEDILGGLTVPGGIADSVNFTVGSGATQQSCSGMLSNGYAGCSLVLAQPNSATQAPIQVTFPGDGYYLSSVDTEILHFTDYIGQAYGVGISAAAQGPLLVNDTGTIVSSGTSSTSPTILSTTVPPATLTVLQSSVRTGGASADTESRARVASVTLRFRTIPVITLNGIDANVQSSCNGSSGYGAVTSVEVNGSPIPVTTGVNAIYPLPGGFQLELNRQDAVLGATHGLAVIAAEITGPSGIDVVLGYARAEVQSC